MFFSKKSIYKMTSPWSISRYPIIFCNFYQHLSRNW